MSRVVKSVRQDMVGHEGFELSGSFPTDCQEGSVQSSLKSLINMLLYGNNITDQNIVPSQASLAICQPNNLRHTKKREPPLPLYVGLNVHTLTRSKRTLTRLYELRISASYERTLELEDGMTTALCNRFVAEDSVLKIQCPAQLREGIFTVGALDNIDHNLSSTTAQGSFHGTSISLFQFPTVANPGIIRPPLTLSADTSHAPLLPDSYRIVPDVACNIKAVTVSQVDVPNTTTHHLAKANNDEIRWIQHSTRLLEHESLPDPVGISSLLPLFFEKAATIQIVRHGMNLVRQATDKLNQGQTPVMAVDQPLFALCKYVQWTWKDTFGEAPFVMLGGLHVEMASWKMVGDLLLESGWTLALNDAGIVSGIVASQTTARSLEELGIPTGRQE